MFFGVPISNGLANDFRVCFRIKIERTVLCFRESFTLANIRWKGFVELKESCT